MARRPERNEEVALTPAEIQQLQKRLESYEWAAIGSVLQERPQPLFITAAMDS